MYIDIEYIVGGLILLFASLFFTKIYKLPSGSSIEARFARHETAIALKLDKDEFNIYRARTDTELRDLWNSHEKHKSAIDEKLEKIYDTQMEMMKIISRRADDGG